MKKHSLLVLFALASVLSLSGQTTAKKPVTRRPASGPTKETGEGVKTSSGLQYWDIKPGTGAEAKPGGKGKGHYTGWLTSGKKFDSSVGSASLGFTRGQGQ